jgi:hypothetical protein
MAFCPQNEYLHLRDGEFIALANDLPAIMRHFEDGDILFRGKFTPWPSGEDNRVWALFQVFGVDQVGTGEAKNYRFPDHGMICLYWTEEAALELKAKIQADSKRAIAPITQEHHQSIKRTLPEHIVIPIFPTELDNEKLRKYSIK